MTHEKRAVPRFDRWQAASRGHSTLWPSVVSAAVHAAAILIVGWSVGAGARAISADSSAFFVPPPLRPPSAAAAHARNAESIVRVSLPGLGLGQPVPVTDVATATRVPPRPTGNEKGQGQRADSVVSEQAYQSFEVDNAAVFSAASAVPAYPPRSRRLGSRARSRSGSSWIANGAADTDTFEVVATSRQEFADAVRTALPHMRFSPARLNRAPVRQVVEQTFRFEIPRARPDSGAYK